MVQVGSNFEQLQLDVATKGRKQMIGLGANRLGGRLFERSVLLQRLMKGFDVAPFAVDGHDPVVGEVEVAAHQIVATGTAVFVCEDLLDQLEWEIYGFQLDDLPDTRF